ncbi:MAG: hypothetical protein WA869_16515, partial [Alloacidobacterium sp.]
EPVANVARRRQAGQPKNADGIGHAPQGRGNFIHMRAPGIVIVWNQNNVATAQAIGVFGQPLIRAAWAGRRGNVEFSQTIAVLFALYDEDALFGRRRLNQFRQAVKNTAGLFPVPNPTAATIRPPLFERLRLVTQDLEQQFATFIRVVVDRSDARRGAARIRAIVLSAFRRCCEVRDQFPAPKFIKYVRRFASGKAMHYNESEIPIANQQGWVPVATATTMAGDRTVAQIDWVAAKSSLPSRNAPNAGATERS